MGGRERCGRARSPAVAERRPVLIVAQGFSPVYTKRDDPPSFPRQPPIESPGRSEPPKEATHVLRKFAGSISHHGDRADRRGAGGHLCHRPAWRRPARPGPDRAAVPTRPVPARHHRDSPGALPGAGVPAAEHPRLPAADRRWSPPSTWCRRRSSRSSTVHNHTAITAANIEQYIAEMDAAEPAGARQSERRQRPGAGQAEGRLHPGEQVPGPVPRLRQRRTGTAPGGPGWAEKAVADLEASIRNGAIGLKIAKDLGLRAKKADGIAPPRGRPGAEARLGPVRAARTSR